MDLWLLWTNITSCPQGALLQHGPVTTHLVVLAYVHCCAAIFARFTLPRSAAYGRFVYYFSFPTYGYFIFYLVKVFSGAVYKTYN